MSDVPAIDTNSAASVPVSAPAGRAEAVLTAVPAAITPERVAANGRFTIRIWCSFIFAICVGMLGVGLWLRPDVRGTGSHEQLGLPPCGFFLATGIPCPTCGCTTAVSHFSHGHFVASLMTQPFGFGVAPLAALLVPLTAIGSVTGKWLGPSMFTLAWFWPTWLYGGVAFLAGAWVYKIIMIKENITF